MESATLSEGPVVVLVSIPQQTMHVYRNGILIGRSTVAPVPKATTRPAASSLFWKKRDASLQEIRQRAHA